MAIERQVKKIPLGEGMTRYKLVILGEECPGRTNESRIHQAIFLHWLADNQTMLVCGYAPFEKLRISHNGKQWVAEAEADVDESGNLLPEGSPT